MHVIVVKYILSFPTFFFPSINTIIFYYNQNFKTPKLHIFGIQIEKMIANSSLVRIGLHVAPFYIPISFILSHMLTFKIFTCCLTIFFSFFSYTSLEELHKWFTRTKGAKLTKVKCNKVLCTTNSRSNLVGLEFWCKICFHAPFEPFIKIFTLPLHFDFYFVKIRG